MIYLTQLVEHSSHRYLTGHSRASRVSLLQKQMYLSGICVITGIMVPITGRESSFLEFFCIYDKRLEFSKTI